MGLGRGASSKNSVVQKGHIELLVGERFDGEHDMAASACNDYLRMGRGRSFVKLVEHYENLESEAKKNKSIVCDVPTTSRSTLSLWSSKYNWMERANKYDSLMEQQRNLEAAKIMESGYALTHNRVAMLDALANKVYDILEKKGLERTVTKGIGFGEQFQTVTETEFRRDEIRELRGLLDDLAQETGGRQKSLNVNASGLAGLLSGSGVNKDDEIEDAEFEIIETDDK